MPSSLGLVPIWGTAAQKLDIFGWSATVLSRDWTNPKPGLRIETEIKGACIWLRDKDQHKLQKTVTATTVLGRLGPVKFDSAQYANFYLICRNASFSQPQQPVRIVYWIFGPWTHCGCVFVCSESETNSSFLSLTWLILLERSQCFRKTYIFITVTSHL